MSQITTHILDTSMGCPAEGVKISLQKPEGDNWETLSWGLTNNDGRVVGLLAEGKILAPGTYRMLFEVDDYFKAQGKTSFYPFVPVVFQVFDDSHYHVPLLLNPYGYSTYRGS